MEPWLRGELSEVDPLRSQVLYSFRQAIEEVEIYTGSLSWRDMWTRPADLAPIGFHIRHILGSIDRLLTYAEGNSLSQEQFAELALESAEPSLAYDIGQSFIQSMQKAAERVRSIDPRTYDAARKVGRKQVPTTVGNLLVHIAEHTQRHLGQLITTSKVLRSMGQP